MKLLDFAVEEIVIWVLHLLVLDDSSPDDSAPGLHCE